MRADTRTATNLRRPAALLTSAIGFALIILMGSFGFAVGTISAPETNPPVDNDMEPAGLEPDDRQDEVESVTMSISLEEGGVIDLDAPVADVKLERWDGDDVLVIVEKSKRAPSKNDQKPCAEAVNIHVSRHGKDVRIHASGDYDWERNGFDLSFRILLPNRYDADPYLSPFQDDYGSPDTMTRLTSTLWRAIQKEALRWMVR